METVEGQKKTFDYIWISTRRWTGAFELAENGKIINTPPIGYRFYGWHYHRLLEHLHHNGWLLDWRIYYKEDTHVNEDGTIGELPHQ